VKDKIRKGEDLRNYLEDLKLKRKRIVFTNGCFDLLHIGHIRYLEEAKALGDILVVGVNSDSSVRRLKGPQRPITPLEERMEVLSSLECVDYVTFFDEPTPLELISLLQPHVLVKGGDWSKETTVGKEVVERLGGEVVILPFVEGASTSNLVETILRRYGKTN
jgi:D-beta-D-heptose 7-phosphate kinase / D-beta-D-heptose 1-phosphate adenosyltransferase